MPVHQHLIQIDRNRCFHIEPWFWLPRLLEQTNGMILQKKSKQKKFHIYSRFKFLKCSMQYLYRFIGALLPLLPPATPHAALRFSPSPLRTAPRTWVSCPDVAQMVFYIHLVVPTAPIGQYPAVGMGNGLQYVVFIFDLAKIMRCALLPLPPGGVVGDRNVGIGGVGMLEGIVLRYDLRCKHYDF